jgi:hypothetical protein
MMAEADYNDHDLLILIAERTRVASDKIGELERRIHALETGAATSKGFFSGIDWIRSALLALPPSVGAYLLANGGG